MWRADDPQGNEIAKVAWLLVPYTRGNVLDLGCGPWKAFSHWTGMDNGDEWQGMPSAAQIIGDATDLSRFADNWWDAVVSSHLLEHIKSYKAALKEWWRVIKPGGHLVLYLPHKDHYPNIGTKGANPDHVHDFTPGQIRTAMQEVGGWDLLVDETRTGGMEYSFVQIYRKRTDKTHRLMKKKGKTACVVRYGAFGDSIQASSVFPELKKQGFIVTVMTTPTGYEILKSDPHVDEFLIQDKDQVPNQYLSEHWDFWKGRFDRFINLSESVEGTWLTIPGRIQHYWPESLRREFLDQNYLEWQHKVSDVPYVPQPKFYPTEKEMQWAAEERSKMGRFVILWALSGSSVHKAWPWTDEVVATLMLDFPDVEIVFTGDEYCKILESGWTNEPRIHCRSGVWSIRQSLAFVSQADLVVGPETGILNAASHLPAPKICLLSHSSIENLTRDWVNTISLEPSCACFPCHRMHYGKSEECPEHAESGAAICAVSITPDKMLKAIRGFVDEALYKGAA